MLPAADLMILFPLMLHIDKIDINPKVLHPIKGSPSKAISVALCVSVAQGLTLVSLTLVLTPVFTPNSPFESLYVGDFGDICGDITV